MIFSSFLQNYLIESEGFVSLYDETDKSSKNILAYLDEKSEDGSTIYQNKIKSAHLAYQS